MSSLLPLQPMFTTGKTLSKNHLKKHTIHLSYYTTCRYISSTVGNILNLPTLNEVLTYFGLARSLSSEQALEGLFQHLDGFLENVNLDLNNVDKERSAQNNFISFLQTVDTGLISIRDAFRESTKENGTLINFMKDFDTALYQMSQTNGTRIVLHGLDTIIVDLALAAGLNKTDQTNAKSR